MGMTIQDIVDSISSKAGVDTLPPSKHETAAAPACAPWVWTHSLVRNINGDVVCRGAHIRRVAKAGDEDVRSMTLHRAG